VRRSQITSALGEAFHEAIFEIALSGIWLSVCGAATAKSD